MGNLKNWILVLIALIVLVGGGYFVATNVNDQSDTTNTETTQEQQAQFQTEVRIDYSGDAERETQVESVDFVEGQTAWEVLQSAVGTDNIEYQDYGGDLGIFVQGINGVKPTGNKFWLFKVNGEGADVGVSAYTVQEGDSIEFAISEPTEGQ